MFQRRENREFTQKAFDRVVNFSDAVIAIAMTLLIFPLTNLVTSATGENWWQIFTDNLSRFLATLISFIVIALFWHIHHRSFDRLERANNFIIFWNVIFLFTIVLMPLTNVILMLPGESTDRAVLLIYIGNMILSLFALAMIDEHARSRPYLLAESVRDTPISHVEIWTFSVVLLIAFAIAMIWPHLGTIPLILLCFNSLWIRAVQKFSRQRKQPARPRFDDPHFM